MDTNTLKPFPFYTTNGNKITTDPFVDVFESRDPTPQDVNYPIQKKWFNTALGSYFILSSFNTTSGVIQANWLEITAGILAVSTLTGNDGNPVGAVGSNIDVVGPLVNSAIEFSNGGAGILNAAVKVDNTTVFINGANELTALGSGLTWIQQSSNVTMISGRGYAAISPGGNLEFTLPVAGLFGDIIEVTLFGATSFKIKQGNGQKIRFGNQVTSVGVTGYIRSQHQGDSLKLLCVEDISTWQVLHSVGTFIAT